MENIRQNWTSGLFAISFKKFKKPALNNSVTVRYKVTIPSNEAANSIGFLISQIYGLNKATFMALGASCNYPIGE